MSEPIKKKADLINRIRTKQDEIRTKRALGADQGKDTGADVADPNEAGKPAIPKDTDETPAGSILPPKENANVDGGPAGKTMENASNNAAGAGEGDIPKPPVEPAVTGSLKGAGANLLAKCREVAAVNKAGMHDGDHSQGKDTGKDVKPIANETHPDKPKVDPKTTLPKSQKNEDSPKVTEAAAAAGKGAEVQIEFDDALSLKLANFLKLAHLGAAIVANEENRQLISDVITRQQGQDMAATLIKSAEDASRGLKIEADQEAAFQNIIKNASKEERAQLFSAMQLDEFMAQTSQEDLDKATKLAKLHSYNVKNLKFASERLSYMLGARDNAVALDVKKAMEKMGDAAPPAGADGAPYPEGAGEMEPEMGGLPEMGVEELLALLDNLVATGAIPPEAAAEVAEILMSGEGLPGMGGEEGGLPDGAPADAGGIPAEEEIAAMADESAKMAAKLLKPAATT